MNGAQLDGRRSRSTGTSAPPATLLKPRGAGRRLAAAPMESPTQSGPESCWIGSMSIGFRRSRAGHGLIQAFSSSCSCCQLWLGDIEPPRRRAVASGCERRGGRRLMQLPARDSPSRDAAGARVAASRAGRPGRRRGGSGGAPARWLARIGRPFATAVAVNLDKRPDELRRLRQITARGCNSSVAADRAPAGLRSGSRGVHRGPVLFGNGYAECRRLVLRGSQAPYRADAELADALTRDVSRLPAGAPLFA